MTQPAPKGDDVAHNAPKSDDEKPSSRAVKLDRLARSLFDPSMCHHIDGKGDDSPNSPDNAANPDGAEKSCSEKGDEKGASVPSNRRIDLPWWLRILFACIGGVCVFLAYPDYNLFFLAYIALFFELWAIDSLRPRSAFFVGWLAGTITNTGGFYWISGMLEDFGHMPTWLSMTLCVGLCALQGLVFGLWAWGIRKFDSRSPWVTAVALFVVIEMFFPMIFPWYYANSQYNFVYAVQTADIWGVLGVSALIVTFNVLIYDVSRTAFLRRRARRLQIALDADCQYHKKSIIAALAFLGFAAIYAPIRMHQIDATQAAAPKLSIGMVEGDIGIWEKEDPSKLRNNLFIHHSLSHALSEQGVDLIVWPESSYQATWVWGSQTTSTDPIVREVDAIFTPEFAPIAERAYRTIDAMFGEGFSRNPVIRRSLFEAFSIQAQINGWQTLDPFLPSFVSGFSVPNEVFNHESQIMRRPYLRLIPDDTTFYLPSAEPLRASRKDDLIKLIRPEDISSPIRDFDAALLFGTLTVELTEKGRGLVEQGMASVYRAPADTRKLYNTAHLVDKDGTVLGKYHKNYLLIFGEYIPFADKLSWIYEILPEAGNLTPGTVIETMPFRGYAIGPIICYEDILPRFVQKLSKLRPNVFINITNDAWFGKTSEPMLHLALAMMRTVEHRRWLVRSTNTGVSAFVDANGRLLQKTSIYDAEILRHDVAMMPPSRTLYSYIGDFLGWIALVWVAFLAVLRRRRNKID